MPQVSRYSAGILGTTSVPNVALSAEQPLVHVYGGNVKGNNIVAVIPLVSKLGQSPAVGQVAQRHLLRFSFSSDPLSVQAD